MIKTKRYSFLYVIFNIFILLTPFNSLFDIMGFFTGGLQNKLASLTPIWLKIYKDVFTVICIFLILPCFRRLNNKKLVIIHIFFFVLIVFATISLLFIDIDTILVTIRSYWSLIFIYLGFVYNNFDFRKISKSLYLLILIEIAVQVAQLLYAPDFYGNQVAGYNLRNPGTFLIPSTMAGFAILVYYFADKYNNRFFKFVSVIAIILSNSTTMYLVFIFSIFYKQIDKIKNGVLFFFPFILVGAIALMLFSGVISGRGNDVDISFTARLGIFIYYLHYPLGLGFGLGSAAAVLLGIKNAVIADSMINSSLINMGYIGLILIVLVIYFFPFRYFKHDRLLYFSFIALSTTIITFEMTPFIQIFFFYLGTLMANTNTLKLNYEKNVGGYVVST